MIELKKSVKNTNFDKDEEVQLLIDEYKEKYLELKQAISELRKQQKNPVIPDALARNIPSKIQYAQISKTKYDCAQIEVQLLEVYKEIQYCQREKIIDIPKEIEETFKTQLANEEVSDGTIQQEEEGRNENRGS